MNRGTCFHAFTTAGAVLSSCRKCSSHCAGYSACDEISMASAERTGHTKKQGKGRSAGLQTDLSISEHLQLLCKDLHAVWGCQQGLVQLLVPSNMGQDGISMSQDIHMGLATVATPHALNNISNASCFCMTATSVQHATAWIAYAESVCMDMSRLRMYLTVSRNVSNDQVSHASSNADCTPSRQVHTCKCEVPNSSLIMTCTCDVQSCTSSMASHNMPVTDTYGPTLLPSSRI